MTRDEALLKLIAVEPATEAQLLLETGWPVADTKATLQQLVAERRVTWWHGYERRWFCLVGSQPAQGANP